MTLITCPDCGHSISDTAPACIHCGRPHDQAAGAPIRAEAVVAPVGGSRTPAQVLVQPSSLSVACPLFPVATHKFIILSICSFSIYELYWCYQNWKRLKVASAEGLSPFWRAFFAPLWGFSLFGRIRAVAASQGVTTDWSAGVLGTFYLVLSIMWRLPDPWWWISFASLVPMVPVQQAAQRVNERHLGSTTEARNDSYSTANVATIVVGGLFLVLAVVGTFMPE